MLVTIDSALGGDQNATDMCLQAMDELQHDRSYPELAAKVALLFRSSVELMLKWQCEFLQA